MTEFEKRTRIELVVPTYLDEGRRCEKCVFFQEWVSADHGEQGSPEGDCRRYPPLQRPLIDHTKAGRTDWDFPYVYGFLECGEWKPKS